MNAFSAMKKNAAGEPRFWEGGEHFQAWYPLVVAEDLELGKLVGREFLDTKVIVYRDPAGKAVVQTAYCPHMGADLSDGALVDGEVRCPYHHWKFKSDGFCSHIPSGITPPRAAKIFNYPVAERWGLIWAFNGKEPLYECPSFDGEESDYIFMARKREEAIPTDAWIQATNGLDFQHLTAVHNMPSSTHGEVTFSDCTIEYPFLPFSPEGKNRMYGPNCLASHLALPLPSNNYVIFAVNAPKPGLAESFWVAAVKQEPGETREQANARLMELDTFLFGFFDEDDYVLKGLRMRLPGEAKLIKDDYYLAKYFNWLDKFPRAKPFDT